MAGGALVKASLKGLDAGSLIGDAFNVWGAASDYKMAREEGNSRGVSIAKAAGSFAYGEAVFGGMSSAISDGLAKTALSKGAQAKLGMGLNVGVMAAYIGVTAGAQLISAAGQHNAKVIGDAYSSKGKFGSGYFEMSQAGYTMRQRSLSAIHNNGLNTQSVLGNEARTYFRSTI